MHFSLTSRYTSQTSATIGVRWDSHKMLRLKMQYTECLKSTKSFHQRLLAKETTKSLLSDQNFDGVRFFQSVKTVFARLKKTCLFGIT